MRLPNPDDETQVRLLTALPSRRAHIASAVMSAVVAYLIGSTDAGTAAGILRDWANEIDKPS